MTNMQAEAGSRNEPPTRADWAHSRITDTRAMPEENILADFPADQFTLFAHCGACGASAPVSRETLSALLPIPAIGPRLRCRACGRRGGEIRIVYTAGPIFRHRARTLVRAPQA
jgi:hypothetical protein